MKTWVYLLILVAVYVGCGFWFAGNGHVEEWIYRIGLLMATFAPLLFTVVYAMVGHWNRLGGLLVQAALALTLITGPLAYVFWVDNGVLTQSWLAWAEVAGPVAAVLVWIRLCFVWIAHSENNNEPSA